MYNCNKCKSKFLFPDMVQLDSGMIHYQGAIVRYAPPHVNICPECRSVDIEKSESSPFIVTE